MFNKICHLTTVHSIDDVRIFLKECTSLATNNFDVTLIACGDTAFEDTKNGIKRISLYIPVKNRFQRFIKRTKAVYEKALLIDASIYHLHDPELLPIGLKLKRKGKKVIYDAHEDVPRQILRKEYIPLFFRKIVSVICEKIENYCVSRLDAVVTVTDHIAERFISISKHVVVCSNYALSNEFETEITWDTIRTNICYVGGLTKIRGISEVVEAAKKVNVPIELAGSFESKRLEEEIINEEVIYHGSINRDKVKIIFSRCFAGIINYLPAPNHNNACPNKLFEYMAAGLPVIASDFEAWKAIVEENKLGICVDPTNTEKISDAILYLKNNPKIAQQMGLNGRRAFKAKYNWQIEEKKLFVLYNELN